MPQFGAHPQRIFLLRRAHQNIRHRRERRVLHEPPKLQLLLIEPGEIMLRRKLDRIVILKISLQNNFSRRIASPRAPRDLRQQLKGSFRGAKIRDVQIEIGCDRSDERHLGEVQALGNHLRADENVRVVRETFE